MIFTPSIVVDSLLVVVMTIVVAHFIYQRRQGTWLFCDPLTLFWLAALTCYVGQPISFYDVFRSWHGEWLIVETLAWVAFGFVFLIIGYHLSAGPRFGRWLPAMPRALHPNRLMLSAVGMIAMSLAGYAYLMSVSGGAADWLSVSRGGTDFEAATGYIGQLEHLLPVGVMLLMLHVSMHRETRFRRIVVAAIVVAFALWLLYLGSRSRLIHLVIAAIAAYYLPRRRNAPLPFLAISFVVLFFAAQFIGHYRGNFANLSFNLDEIDTADAESLLLPEFLGGDKSAQFDTVGGGIEFNVVMSVINLVPDSVPFNLGYGHLEIFTRPIPRAFWPDKRYPLAESVQGVIRGANLSDSRVLTTNRELYVGPAFTFVGHWYYVAGPFGLAFGGLLTGILLRAIRTIYDRSPGSEGDVVLFLALVPIGFGEAVGTPLHFLTVLPFQVIPLLLFLWLCGTSETASTRPRRTPFGAGVRA